MKKFFIFLLTALIAFPVQAASIVIQPGDTLSALALKYGTTVQELALINNIQNPDLIYAGQTLETDSALGVSIPTVIAVYTDSLASRISNTATSFTLVRGTDKQGRSLSGYYGFVLDEGTTSEEFLTANCVATACTISARGIDVVDGTSAVTALKFEHRRGATVKISNFPQLAVLSRILNGQESASSTFRFGSGNTTDNKCLKADNGTSDFPYICYNEATDRWQFSDDGLNSITFTTSSAGGLSASTTKGIFITDSQVGINASSTAGISFDSNGYAYFNGTNRYPATFYATSTFNGNVTTTGTFTVNTPTSTRDAANKGYVDSSVYFGAATGTAGIAITAGQALYMSTTSTLFKTNSDAASSTYQFVGIAITSAASSSMVTYSRPGEINCSQSGLSPGYSYYLNGATGQISTTPGTKFARIGRAISATCIQLLDPKFIEKGSTTISGTGDTFITTGFYPAHITIRAGSAGVGGQIPGISIGDDTNNCIVYDGGVTGNAGTNASKAWSTKNSATTLNDGTVSAKSATGFTLTATTAGGNAVLQWVAYSE